MWSNLPFDVLANIFSFLSPDSLARAISACRNWHTCAKYLSPPETQRHHPAWFLAVPTRCRSLSCYTRNPIDNNWHILSLQSIPNLARPIATIDGLVIFRPTTTGPIRLAVCNPFTRQFRHLPMLNVARINPAVGLVQLGPQAVWPNFQVYVAGGMLEMPGGSASYEPTLEMYDSQRNTWRLIGPMPVEFSVRLTVWTPNESVYSNGFIYWMTSARAYSIMGFEIGQNKWRELSVPMADRLEFAAIVPRNGKLTLVGGTGDSDVCVWELGEGDIWGVVDKVPFELRVIFFGWKGNWGNTKCVGIDGIVCLYRDIGSGMVVWREDVGKGRWEWLWIKECYSVRSKEVGNFPIKGLLLYPNLAPSCLLNI